MITDQLMTAIIYEKYLNIETNWKIRKLNLKKTICEKFNLKRNLWGKNYPKNIWEKTFIKKIFENKNSPRKNKKFGKKIVEKKKIKFEENYL